jgi:dihydrofolate reductase
MTQRKVILSVATSLDGFMVRKDGSVDWLFMDQNYGMVGFFSVDVALPGRKTYDSGVSKGMPVFPSMESIVFTRTTPGKHDPRVTFTSSDVREVISICAGGLARTAGWLAEAKLPMISSDMAY